MQLTDNKPCPHLHEYITHHALNQAKYLKCERVVWTSCPHPLCSAYIHSVRSPGEADESIWGAVGRCWTSPQHPRLDGHHERETRGGEKVRNILISYIQKMAGGGKRLGNLILETTWHATLPSKGAAGSLGRRKAWGGRMQSRITRKSSLTGN